MVHIEVVAAFLVGAFLSRIASDFSSIFFSKKDEEPHTKDVGRAEPDTEELLRSYEIDGRNAIARREENLRKIYEMWGSMTPR